MRSLQISKQSITVKGQPFEPALVPELIQRHPRGIESALQLEAQAQPIRRGRFLRQELRDFIRAVCAWGGYSKTAARVLGENPFPKVRRHFERAALALGQREPNIRWALRELSELRFLGVSFASKHLRFLRPEICPVLDSVLSEQLGYPLDGRGYQLFAEDCLQIAEILRKRRVPNPFRRAGGVWFAAEVEMALYVFIKEEVLERSKHDPDH